MTHLVAVDGIAGFEPHPQVTFLVGPNGCGKSTVVEALALRSGFSVTGGEASGKVARTTWWRKGSYEHVRCAWRNGRPPLTGWFLRAESAWAFDTVEVGPLGSHEPIRMHERSHGEAFIDLAAARFARGGFVVCDEPEAALSVDGCLRFLAVIHESVRAGTQMVIATHSPFLVAYPDAWIYRVHDVGRRVERISYDDVDAVRRWREFLDDPVGGMDRIRFAPEGGPA